MRENWAVCVYCASGPNDPELLKLAGEIGTGLADRGWTLVWGGGHVSAMGAVSEAARMRGGRTVGVIPERLIDREVADLNADELLVTETMRQRKQIMEDRADAFLTLPGGIGTLEEFFEAWTGRQLGIHDKPVVLLDALGHYGGLLHWLDGLAASGYIPDATMRQLTVVDSVAAALDACAPSVDRLGLTDSDDQRKP